jgi:hypothetical protein
MMMQGGLWVPDVHCLRVETGIVTCVGV